MSNSIDEANLKKFYEFTRKYPTTMYDNIEYVRDQNFCHSGKIGLCSGNLTKYTNVSVSEKSYKIDSN